MNWKGRELATIGDLSDAMEACKTREDAQAFMAAYRAENEHADVNIGYLTGYYDWETADRMRDWFGVTHPVFGDRHPTFDEALEAGKRMAAEVSS